MVLSVVISPAIVSSSSSDTGTTPSPSAAVEIARPTAGIHISSPTVTGGQVYTLDNYSSQGIQDAINSVTSGTTIVFKAGTYSISSPVLVDKSVALTTDTGTYRYDTSGSGKVILAAAAAQTDLNGRPSAVFQLGGSADPTTTIGSPITGIKIEGFTFVGAGVEVPGTGAGEVLIANNSFTSMYTEAIGYHGNPVGSCAFPSCATFPVDNFVNISGNVVTGVSTSVLSFASGFWLWNLQNSTVEGNIIMNTSYAGIIFTGTAQGDETNNTLAGNFIQDVPQQGLQVAFGRNVVVTGNVIVGAGYGGTTVGKDADISLYNPNQADITIAGNTLSSSFEGLGIGQFGTSYAKDALGPGISVSGNNLINNTVGVVNNAGSGTLSADGNWWNGSAPTLNGFNGYNDTVSVSSVSSSPFNGLVLPTSCQRYVYNEGSGANAIAKAITAASASAGSTVCVGPGVYPEQLAIHEPITLSGYGVSQTVIAPTSVSVVTEDYDTGISSAPILWVNTSASGLTTPTTVEELTIDGGPASNTTTNDFFGIYVQSSNAAISNVVVKSIIGQFLGYQGYDAIFANNGALGAPHHVTQMTVVVFDSTVVGYGKNGITCNDPGATCIIQGNAVQGLGPLPGAPSQTAENGIQLGFGATGKVAGNTVTGNVFTGLAGCPNTEDYFTACAVASGVLLYDAHGPIPVSGNTVIQNDVGIYSIGTNSTTVSNNLISQSPAYALVFDMNATVAYDGGSAYGVGGPPFTATAYSNAITDSNVGVLVYDDNATFQGNSLTNVNVGFEAVTDAVNATGAPLYSMIFYRNYVSANVSAALLGNITSFQPFGDCSGGFYCVERATGSYALSGNTFTASSFATQDLATKVPSSFSTASPVGFTRYSMITGSAWDGNAFLVVGSRDFQYNGSGVGSSHPIMGLYFPSNGAFLDLSSLFAASADMSSWALSATAWNGTAFVIAGFYFNTTSPTGVTMELATYNPATNALTNVSSIIPASARDWTVGSLASNGAGLTYIAGDFAPPNPLQAAPEFGVLSSTGFANVSGKLPSSLAGHILLAASYGGGGTFYLASVAASAFNPDTGGFGDIYMDSFNAANYRFTSLVNTTIPNYYTNGGITWDGSALLIDSAIPGTYELALYYPTTSSVTLLPSSLATAVNGVPQQFAWSGSEFLMVGLSSDAVSPLFGTMYSAASGFGALVFGQNASATSNTVSAFAVGIRGNVTGEMSVLSNMVTVPSLSSVSATGISLGVVYPTAGYPVTFGNYTVADNAVLGPGNVSAPLPSIGILVYGVNAVVHGNLVLNSSAQTGPGWFVDSQSVGISVGCTDFCSVSGNVLTDDSIGIADSFLTSIDTAVPQGVSSITSNAVTNSEAYGIVVEEWNSPPPSETVANNTIDNSGTGAVGMFLDGGSFTVNSNILIGTRTNGTSGASQPTGAGEVSIPTSSIQVSAVFNPIETSATLNANAFLSTTLYVCAVNVSESEGSLTFLHFGELVTVAATGAPPSEPWSVALTGWITVPLAGSGSSVAVIDLQNSSAGYPYEVTPPASYAVSSANPPSPLVIDGTPVTLSVSFEGIGVTFTESGLLPGTTWSVTLNGLTQSSSASTITFSGLTEGSSFSYTVGAVNGYTVSPGPGSGTVPASVPITFTGTTGTFAATFTESNLASGTVWSVTLAGVGTRSTTGTTISFAGLSVGTTYDYTIGAVSGYTTTTSTGVVSSGFPSVTVAFTAVSGTFTAVFTESGLASGTVWSVTVAGVGTRSTTGTTISFPDLSSTAAYTYTVGAVSGYTSSPSSGPVTASVPITFSAASGTFAETFTESGLASGAVWGVTIGGLTKYTSASSITFVGLTSGATYTVDPPRGYTASPPSGTLTAGGTTPVSFSTASVLEPAAAGISSAGSGGSSGLLVLVGWTAMVGALAGGLLLVRRPASSRREL